MALSVWPQMQQKPKMCIVKHEIKEELLSEEVGCRLKLGIRRNSNGQWEINKRGDTDLVLSSDNEHASHIENKSCITLSDNIDDTTNGEDGCNLKQERKGSPMTHVHDLDSSASDKNAPPASTEEGVIVLSDSDDDAVMVLSPSAVSCGTTHDTGNLFPPNPPEISGEQPGGCPNETSFHVLKEGFGDLGLSFWECPLSPRDDHTYQILDTNTRVTDNQGEVENYCPNYNPKHGSVSGGDSGPIAANPVGDEHDDALQPCTSSERDGAIGLANLSDNTQTCDDGHSDKWTSVSTSGTDEGLIDGTIVSQKRRNPGDGITALDASVVGSTNDNDVTGERFGGPFSSAQQQERSVRPRLILTIDSDSD